MATLTELFARDPHDNTKEDIDRVIEYYRIRGVQYYAGVKDAGATKRFEEPIDLEELGL